MKRKKLLVGCLILVAAVGIGGGVYIGYTSVRHHSSNTPAAASVFAGNLNVPWGLAFMPDGDMVVTERSGNLTRIGTDRQTHTIEGVEHTSEGGLLGIVLDPQFAQNGYLYVYLTTRVTGNITNQIERYTYQDDRLSDRRVIFAGIPGSQNHDGGRLAFGPDGKLYATTGDAGDAEAAQHTRSLAGKILRLNADGTVPPDNPFGNAVYSYGHRNPQGLAWDDQGRLWATEHGRSGGQSGFDELNLIIPGGNYGWPVVEGDESHTGMKRPVIHSGATDTWAPAGLAYANGSLYFGGLRGETLYRASIHSASQVTLKTYYKEAFGRLRTTALGPDGLLYFTTSNTDGRGESKAGDDKILRSNLAVFK